MELQNHSISSVIINNNDANKYSAQYKFELIKQTLKKNQASGIGSFVEYIDINLYKDVVNLLKKFMNSEVYHAFFYPIQLKEYENKGYIVINC
jgi:hypothetical protein